MNLKTLTDEQLIRRVQDGDTESYNEIVSRFSRPLYNFIYRIVGQAVLSEDLLQETFLRLWLNKHSYKEIARFSTWLYTVAGNLAKSELRKQKIRRWIPIGDSGEEFTIELPDKSADPHRDYERRNILRRVEEEVRKLPHVFKEVIILRDIQELSYEEISSTLGIPLGTVKSRVNRARQRLQKKLSDLR